MRMKGLEPPRPETLDPKSNAATNYATCALGNVLCHTITTAKVINPLQSCKSVVNILNSLFNVPCESPQPKFRRVEVHCVEGVEQGVDPVVFDYG